MTLNSKVTVLAEEAAVSVTSLPRKFSRSQEGHDLTRFIRYDLMTLKSKVSVLAEEAAISKTSFPRKLSRSRSSDLMIRYTKFMTL